MPPSDIRGMHMKKIFKHILPMIHSTRADKIRFCAFVLATVLGISAVSVSPLMTTYTHADEYSITDDYVNVRSGPGTDYDVLGSVSSGQKISSSETVTDDNGDVWYAFSYNGTQGYVRADFVSSIQGSEDTAETSADTREETTTVEPESYEEETTAKDEWSEGEIEALGLGDQPAWSGYVQSDAEFEASISQFPESYKPYLRAIHAVYPNYKFTADYVGLDYETVVDEEVGKKVSSSSANSWRAMYDESYGWYENYDWDTGEWAFSEGFFTYASREVIEYYIDPRNFLNTTDIYMFMRQSYSSSQTLDDLRSMVNGSFLADGYIPNKSDENDVRLGGDYVAVLMEAAQYSGVSPFVLAATIIVEQGWSGETPLATGYYVADDGTVYDGYYNFYDIGATGSDNNNVLVNGFEYAISAGWDSVYKCLVNGATWYADSYISNGQDTYYYREFNVTNGYDGLYHQYATAVVAAQQASYLLRNQLSDSTYAALEFRIPVYEDMPDIPVTEPAYDDKLNNYYFTDMQATGLEPEFSMANRNYTMTMTGDTTLSISVPKWATYNGYDSYAIYAGSNDISLSVTSQTGYVRTYKIAVTASQDCTLYVNTVVGNRLNITDDADSDNTSSETDGDILRGDANGDGKISALDYITIKNHIMETKVITDSQNLSAADMNGDGKISALDYIAIKNYIMSK